MITTSNLPRVRDPVPASASFHSFTLQELKAVRICPPADLRRTGASAGGIRASAVTSAVLSSAIATFEQCGRLFSIDSRQKPHNSIRAGSKFHIAGCRSTIKFPNVLPRRTIAPVVS